MTTILNLFLIIFLFLTIMVISVVVRILSSFHNLRKRTRARTDRSSYSQDSSSARNQEYDSATGKKKIIPKDEGEYVDYEEL